MNKVLLINGSPHPNGCTYTILREIGDTLISCGVDYEVYQVGRQPVQDCLGCGQCKKNGFCVVDDGVNEIGARLSEFDGMVVGSPVYFSGNTGQVGSFLDRLFYSCHPRMAGKVGASVVSCRRSGSTAALERLNQYFLYSNMIVVGSQYWNQVHGHKPEEVRQDLEGMQIMRNLARNMAWILKSIECGKNAGLALPERETRARTSIPELLKCKD